MIISPSRRFVFVHIPKTGGTALTLALESRARDIGRALRCVVCQNQSIDDSDAPLAADDSYSVGEDAVVTITAPGVIGNDTDAENNSLTATLVGSPSNGNVIVYGDGSFDYTPALAFAGTDTFTYTVSDGVADSNTATVTITVTNNAPVAVADTYTMNEDTVLTIAAPWLARVPALHAALEPGRRVVVARELTK